MALGSSSSSGEDKVKATESDTPSVSSSSAASSVCGDAVAPTPKPKTGLVATYFLRSMDWKSKRIDTSTATADTKQKVARQTEERENDDVKWGGQLEGEEDSPAEVEADPDAFAATEGGMQAQEEMGERANRAAEKKEFEVKYQCLPDIEELTDTVEEESACGLGGRRPMQYLDVLLQTDEHGIGLNVGPERVDEGEKHVLMVQSFRRMSSKDVGPAEACGKIRVGDILHAVDGEDVCSLQQLHGKLAGRLGKRKKFVLLRFLRPVAVPVNPDTSRTSFFDGRRRPVDARETNWSEADALLHGNPQIATLVRKLATTNRLLQEQLIASRLKQEEQNIQLDQLHALYARTQAEGLPLFSLSKSIRPFSRKSTSVAGDRLEKPIPTKIQTEVIEAVSAEYARLQQEFQLQHMLDKQELERKYAEKVGNLEEAMTKKVEMLEAGFQHALQQFDDDHQCPCCCQRAIPEFSDMSGDSDVSLQISHTFSEDVENTGSIRSVESTVQLKEGQTVRQILGFLETYQEIKHARQENFRHSTRLQ